ncbi:MAG: mobile mystery protein A [Pseudomonadales bacterium]|nr:mobile mystery protein A [Pseudomonadales bacterium]
MSNLKAVALEQTRELANQGLSIKLIQPIKGWVYTMRNALGMTGAQLGERMGVKKGRISQIEQMEIEGRVTLQQLKRAANAMDCELIYAFRPQEPVETMVVNKAKKKAFNLTKETQIHMGLEAQGLSKKSFEREVKRLTDEFTSKLPRDLWDEEV